MTETSERDVRHFAWSSVIPRARLYSGLVLFIYVTMHLGNHVAGLWSIAALDAGLDVIAGIWRSPVMTVLLYGGLAVHLSIALRAIYLRDSLRAMSRPEIAQVTLGLAIPLLLIDHVMATRFMAET